MPVEPIWISRATPPRGVSDSAVGRNTLLLGVLLLAVGAAIGALLFRRGEREPSSEPPTQTTSPAPEAVRVVATSPSESVIPKAAPRDPEAGSDPWIELNNRSAEALEAGELARAVAGFERCHEARLDDDIFRRNLAEALTRLARTRYEERELTEAIERLERALELAPERKDAEALTASLERWRTEREIEGDHWSEGSDLFTLSFDTDRRDILHDSQDVLDHLEASYEELRLWFGADPVRELGRAPIRVVLYNPTEFDRVTGLGDWAGGVFDGSVRVSMADLQAGAVRWRATLKHELVHVFVHELGGSTVPGWLNEGLAQLLESEPVRLGSARERLRGAEPFPLERLQGSLATWSDAAAIGRAYAQSLLFVAELRQSYGEEALRRMVLAKGRGETVSQAFEAWASVPLAFAFETWKAER